MNKPLLTLTLGLAAAATAQAQVIYQNDFSSAQVIIDATNGNTNYVGAGAGAHAQANINYGEWMEGQQTSRNELTYDSGNENMFYESNTVNSTFWHLVDTSATSSALNGETATLSFDVSNYINTANAVLTVSVWDGSGLTFSGLDGNTTDGFLVVRSQTAEGNIASTSNSSTSDIVLNNGTGTNAIAKKTITGAGLFTMDFTFNGATGGSALGGGYILIGLGSTSVNPGASFNIDDLAIAIPEPSSFALLAGLLGLGSVMVRRRR